MNISHIRSLIKARGKQVLGCLSALKAKIKPRAVKIRGIVDRFLKGIGLQLNTLMRFIIPIGVSMVVALKLATSKGASFVGGPEIPILPEQKDFVLKHLDFFASEGQLYLAVVLSMTGAGLTKAYALLGRKGSSVLHWAGVVAVGTGFFFGLTEWGFLQMTLHVVLKTNHFGDTFFQKLMTNLQAAMVYTGLGTLLLLAIPSREEEMIR
jgi:hypothetical protein